MTATIIHGNNLDILPTFDDCSIDAIVTDPPYELGFMGKRWDASGIAYNVTLWQECLRVLKPGGHLLAFGGTRTYHRMACAIEDAGFEIRDSIHWLYGSGFPKSLDVSKAIDKQAGTERDRVPYVGGIASGSGNYGGGGKVHVGTKVADTPATEQAKEWAGWGTALKPAHEPIVVARKPLVGTVAANVLEHGTGAINIDASRIGGQGGSKRGPDDIGDDSGTNAIYGKGLGLANAAPKIDGLGRWPANVILTHTEDCQQVGVRDDTMHAGERTANFGTQETQSGGNGSGDWGSRSVTVPVCECVPGCPVALLDRQSGVRPGGNFPKGGKKSAASDSVYGAFNGTDQVARSMGDSGGASRFFYCAKPSRKERNAGLDHLEAGHPIGGSDKWTEQDRRRGEGVTRTPTANVHPTVKPLALMRYLVRLVTPPGGTVLDPFAGSGTTLMAAILEGFNPIGIEITDEYLPIIQGRIAWAEQQANNTPDQQELDL